jgi:hypothetical protein
MSLGLDYDHIEISEDDDMYKPCPHCGEKPKELEIMTGFGGQRVNVVCGCTYIDGERWRDVLNQAVDAWNKRADKIR